MEEIKQAIPARLKNMAIGGHVAGAEDIYDDELEKTQNVINAEIIARLDALEGNT